MNIVENTPEPDRRKSQARSRVGNGKVLLPMTDGRSLTARRFAALYEDICLDLGGVDSLSEGERQLIRRAATLSAESERLEAEWANGREFDIVEYSTISNCLRRVLETIGLHRRAKPVTNAVLDHFERRP
jgi:hypothetical protein